MNKRMTAMAAIMLAVVPATAMAQDFAAQWQQPVQITLPEPMREFVLSGNIDAAGWVEAHGLKNTQLIRQGRQTLVQAPMSEADWNSRQQQLCNAGGVLSCGPGACQSIQFQAQPGNVDNPQALKARIVRNPPDPRQAAAAVDAGEGMCRTATPLPPLDEAAVAGPDVALQIDLPGHTDPGVQQSGARPEPASPSAADAARAESTAAPQSGPHDDATAAQSADPLTQPQQSAPADPYASAAEPMQAAEFELQLQTLPGTPQLLRSGHLPADTTGHTLLVGEGCRQQSVPLDSIAPAHVPGLIVALTGNPTAVASRWNLTVISESKLASSGDTLAVFYSDQPVLAMVGQLQLDPDVLGVSREHIFTTSADSATLPAYSDPFAPFTYGPEQSGALALHSSSTGEGQTIAIIDTGVAHDHEDLAGRVTFEDFTGKGWSADAHGTAVAGIIAAAADNAAGVYGVAPKASILALKACQPRSPGGLQAQCWTSTLVKALDAAMQADAQIINMSLAGPPDDLVARYVALAVQQNRLIIAGAGNGGSAAKPAFPAALPGVLAVTAVSKGEQLYPAANRGSYIDLAAPGVDIVTIAPDGSFPSSSGTSWAAAHVSGIAALLRPLMPLSSAGDIAIYLGSASRDLGEPGRDDQFGDGVVDACAAARTATADAVNCSTSGGQDASF